MDDGSIESIRPTPAKTEILPCSSGVGCESEFTYLWLNLRDENERMVSDGHRRCEGVDGGNGRCFPSPCGLLKSESHTTYVIRLSAPSSARDREGVDAPVGAGRRIRTPRNVIT